MNPSSNFQTQLLKEIWRNAYNFYSKDNWDSDRFGTFRYSTRSRFVSKIKSLLSKRRVCFVPWDLETELNKIDIIKDNISGLSWLYDHLEDDYSKNMLVKIIAYRIMGYSRVKLPVNNNNYWLNKRLATNQIVGDESIKVNFLNWELKYFELDKLGMPIKLFFTSYGLLKTFILKQYEYKNGNCVIKAENGDIVIDAGGCWGDTALYFAYNVGNNGMVYSIEFIPSNLKVMRRNMDLNPLLNKKIEIIEHALWSKSDRNLYCHDNGPGSKVSNDKISEYDFKTTTLSIDDLINKYKVPRVDFIKMDIEGAEVNALKGATETIKKFKPRLAISVYHRLSDFFDVPNFISSLNLNYKFCLNHYTIHQEETILFAQSS